MSNYQQEQLYLLKRKIQQLQNQQRAQLDKQARQFQIELRRLQQKMQNENQAQQKKLEREYQQQLKEYQRFIRGEITSLNKQQQEEIRRKDREIKSLTRQMKEIEQRLKDNLNDLKKNIQDDLLRKKEIASRYVNEFRTVVASFVAMPHKKFTPNKLDTILEVEKEFDVLDNGKMYEAKTAIAISSTSSLHRLEIEVRELSDKWRREYELYKQYTSHLYYSLVNQLANFDPDYANKAKEVAVVADFYLHDISENQINIVYEIDYWAFGNYLAFLQQLQKEIKLIKEIEGKGIDNYLLDEDSISLTSLIEKSQTLNEIINQIFIIYNKAKDNQEKYHLRKDMINEIIKQFEIKRNVQKSLITVEKPLDDSTVDFVNYKILAKNLIGDPRRSLHGLLLTSGELEIHIYIRPEDNGNYYRNVVILYDDFGDQAYLQSAEYDDYKMLIRILRQQGLKINDGGYEENDIWYIPFIDINAIKNLQDSNDINIKRFAGKLNQAIRRR